jgi:hypothetical protein
MIHDMITSLFAFGRPLDVFGMRAQQCWQAEKDGQLLQVSDPTLTPPQRVSTLKVR